MTPWEVYRFWSECWLRYWVHQINHGPKPTGVVIHVNFKTKEWF